MAERIQKKQIEDILLDTGIVVLALSITFSITLMNVALGILLLSLVLRAVKHKQKFTATGLEKSFLIFIAFYCISALASPRPLRSLKDISNNYWYVLHLFVVVYLFGREEIRKFRRIIIAASIFMAIYAIVQSITGHPLLGGLNLSFIPDLRMGLPKLEKVFSLGGHAIFMSTGILGNHLTFGGQTVMLLFLLWGFSAGAFVYILLFTALILSFSYSSWLGFIAALVYFLAYRRKNLLIILSVIAILGSIVIFIPGDINIVSRKLAGRFSIWKTALDMYGRNPLLGVGAGQYSYIFDRDYASEYKGNLHGVRTHPHSVYLDMLTEGGALTLLAFMYFLVVFIRKYSKPPLDKELRRLHISCVLALIAIFSAGLFQTYLTDAENSVLIWTAMGLIIAVKRVEDETA